MSEHEDHGKKSHHAKGNAHGGGAHEEHEGAPEWLISFADNVTLMMGFFVLLLAMNLKPDSGGSGGSAEGSPPQDMQARTLDWAIGIREAFNNPVDPGSLNPNDLPLVRRLIEREGKSAAIKDGVPGREHDVKTIRKGQFSVEGGSVPFATGSDQLDDAARDALTRLARQFRGYNLRIEIHGHTSAAESVDQPDRGLRLSFNRAMNVANALAEGGTPWTFMRIIASGDGERAAPVAYDTWHHQINQRVEIVVTDEVPE